VVINAVRKQKSWDYGYDARENTYGDMFKRGIVDPVKVVRSAMENAISIGGMVLTTESLVADIPAAPAAAMPDMPVDY
jgi:chaperonin GroEL